MLLPMKVTQLNKFRELETVAKAQGKSIRGMFLILRREKGDKSPKIGEPALLEGGSVFDILTEQELAVEYGNEEVRSQDGKQVVRPKNYDITPFNYDEIFPRPDVEDIIKRYSRNGAPSGSTSQALQEFDEADKPNGGGGTAAPARTARRRAAAGGDATAPATGGSGR